MDIRTEDAAPAASAIDARLLLVVYVRALSFIFILSGLQRWGTILGPLSPSGDFLSLAPEVMVATIFFSVADLVAAVGLWLLASWGTVVWLIAALTEVVLHTVFKDIFGLDITLIAFHVATVIVYAGLTALYERLKPDV
ncbi:DUF6163 family protein [Chthonobacter rhizosphaerae]|uniref:DUF6163 family protein n=1 Tax=Chthonobacter rhizosphaerae TaxID=2735553 RepID=UPI0015EF1E61|nr:DUF6163 family protein [Chthonobacter rhizosphaerae]